ncbi:MAG: hypothetical protein KDK36_20100 [Leptospiraceae bacterium]|nr:hypothetical protein [Leptospiraceae bacterium]
MNTKTLQQFKNSKRFQAYVTNKDDIDTIEKCRIEISEKLSGIYGSNRMVRASDSDVLFYLINNYKSKNQKKEQA